MLNKLNKMRNEMEHKYSEPTAEETQDFIDMVEIFIAHTTRLATSAPSYVGMEYDYVAEGDIEIKSIDFPVGEGKIY